MHILNTLARTYRTYRKTMWLTSLIGTFGTPVAGYAWYAANTFHDKRSMLEDNPELAGDIAVVNPWQWLTGMAGWLPTAVRVIVIVGVFLVAATIVGCIVSQVGKRTKLSGRDGQVAQDDEIADRMADDEDDYGDSY